VKPRHRWHRYIFTEEILLLHVRQDLAYYIPGKPNEFRYTFYLN
jgi:hypothetical protein